MKHALVLSGGGAFGAYAVGVTKALSERYGDFARNVQTLTGTSVGAFNIAVLASTPDGKDPAEHLEDVWVKHVAGPGPGLTNPVYGFRADFVRYADPAWVFRDPVGATMEVVDSASYLATAFTKRAFGLLRPGTPFEQGVFNLVDVSEFFSVTPLSKLIARCIDFEQIQQSPYEIAIVATNWTKGTLRIFGKKELQGELGPKAIQASAAIPGIFP